jgi:hypothetical protein
VRVDLDEPRLDVGFAEQPLLLLRRVPRIGGPFDAESSGFVHQPQICHGH